MKLPRFNLRQALFALVAILFLFVLAPPVSATTATLNLRTGGLTGNAGGSGYFCSQTKVVDFALKKDLRLDAWTTTTAGSVVQLFNIPPGSKVLDVSAEILTAQGAACTVKIGDAADEDGYQAACNLNAAAGTVTTSFNATSTPAYGVSKLYTAAGVIGLKTDHTISKAKVRFRVFYLHLKE